MKKNNIVLIGFMGTGKTTVGKIISSTLGYKFADTDDEIEKLCGTSILDIFKFKGEQYFRELEAQIVCNVSKLDKAVISCGGGVVKNSGNVNNLRKTGFIVCLKADPEIIYNRICNDISRPLASQKSKEEIVNLINEREHLYGQADLSLDTTVMSPVSAAARIIDIFKEYS